MKTSTESESYNFFMRMDTRPYIDQWVAIVDNKVVANNKKIKKVLEDVDKKYPKEKPLITKIPSKKAMIL